MPRLWPTVLAIACAPPPLVPAGGGELGIELLFPEPGDQVPLNDDCELDTVIVVDIDGLELVPPAPDDLVEGQGHWHGGPDLASGYCVSFGSACRDYDGAGVRLGLQTLFVQLQNNGHEPLGPEDQVEIEVVPPLSGVSCP